MLIGVKINNKLTFYFYVKELCKKANQKTKALLNDYVNDWGNSLI